MKHTLVLLGFVLEILNERIQQLQIFWALLKSSAVTAQELRRRWTPEVLCVVYFK